VEAEDEAFGDSYTSTGHDKVCVQASHAWKPFRRFGSRRLPCPATLGKARLPIRLASL
jgi:hypothetical protein